MGKKVYNNGVVNRRFSEDDIIPEGFVKGSIPWSEEKKKEVAEKRRQTNLKKYGVDNPSKSSEIKLKKINTVRKHYGVDHTFQSKEIQKKSKQTSIKHYGVAHPSQSKEVKDKIRQTNIKNLGVEYPMQSEEVQSKSKQTNLNKYGCESYSQTDEYKEKFKKTSLDRYGVENPAQLQEVKDKIKNTNIERYGTECSLQNESVKKKALETNIRKYGTESPSSSELIKDKIKNTNLEKYGVENVFQSKEIQDRIKQTNLERYHTEYPIQSKSVQEKSVQTSLSRYGTEYPNQAKEVKDKIEEAIYRRYGVRRPAQSSEIVDRIKATNISRYGCSTANQLEEVKNKTRQTNLERYGVEWTCLRPEARIGSNDSIPNKYFANLLDKYSIEYEREFPLKSFSYDFRVGNILIEIDPTVTHNTVWSPFGNHESRIVEKYHLDKSKVAEENGYRCIHIFDWNDCEIIVKQILLNRDKVYARKCEVREVQQSDIDEYLTKYHLQGTCRGQSVCIALYYKGDIVSLMTFGKPRYNKNYEYELLRYCASMSVTGGSRKLFNCFIKKHNPESIISYCDKSKFAGNVYKSLGFKLKSTNSPSRHWYNPELKKHITDNFLRQRGFDQLFNESYGKGTDNNDLMVEHGFLSVYDCGQATFEWVK